jgi:lyso-ornithine lipid O-acyltransferase
VTSRIRAGAILTTFLLFTLPLMPVQFVLLRLSSRLARTFPHWYHRHVCRIIGITLDISGGVVRNQPVLVVANHVSWLDITVLSAVAPVSFVAKKEVAGWPFAGTLARLQRTVFVDRERRISVGDTASEIMERLAGGDAVVLFAEGTSSDGNRVLPFKTSLFAAAKPSNAVAPSGTVVQTVTVAYTRRNGLPLGWAGRRDFGYIGDVSMGQNAWQFLTRGPLVARIHIAEPIPLADFKDRKDLAKRAEQAVRADLTRSLRE